MPSQQRVVVIGLDSAEWQLMEPMLEAGELPHFAALRRRSAMATLDNPDYRTGLVWEHFLTGRGAAACGRMAAIEFDPATYEVWQEGARPLRPFYDCEPPIRSIVFDVPYVTLAVDAPGVQVTAWGGHDPAYPRSSRPVGLLRELDERFGPHPAFDNDYTIVWNRPRDIDALADALVVGSRRRADALQWLQAREPDWDLAMTVLSEPHSANEQLWHGVDDDPPVGPAGTVALAGRRLREVYRAVDDALGRIVAGLPDDAACVVFSMHGSGRNSSDLASMVLLPELLHRMHAGRPFLRQPDTAAWAAAGRPPVLPGADTSWPVYMRSLLPDARGSWRHRLPPGVRAAYRALRAARPDGTRRGALGRPITDETDESPADIGVIRTTVDWQVPVRYRSHWSAMRAFAVPSFYDGRVRINLQGRERDGIVPADEYELACREVEEVVSACRDPRTHEPVVAEVRRLRDDDPFLPGGPDADLEIVWSHATDSWEHPVAGTIGPFPYRRTGGHSRRGFALVAGPGIEPQDLGERQALDVTATIVALLGRDPVAAGMEGTPLVALALD